MTNFIYVTEDKMLDFLALRQNNPDIQPCELYVDKKKKNIYFVESFNKYHRGTFEDLSDRNKAISSLGL